MHLTSWLSRFSFRRNSPLSTVRRKTQTSVSGDFTIDRLEDRCLLSSVTSVAASGLGITAGNGDLRTAQTAVLAVNFDSPVTVDLTHGAPTLALNNGGTAFYTGGSGTSILTFNYSVVFGQNTSDLAVTGLGLNGATIRNGGVDANLTGAATNPAGTLKTDTVAPTVTLALVGAASQPSGSALQYAATFSENVSGVDPSAFSLTTTGVSGASISSIVQGADAAHYTISISSGSGAGTIGLNITGSNVMDQAGNGFGGGAFSNAPGTPIAVSSTPANSYLADVNGDGNLDLIYAASSSVSVALGNGNGTFGAQRAFEMGSSSTGMVIADFNGDGRPDIASSSYFGANVTIMLGNGDGTFTLKGSVGVPSRTNALAAGDVNGDGKPDIVDANYNNGNVSVLLGTGTGNFTIESGSFGVGSRPTSIVLTDLDGNGSLDIVTANVLSNNVSVLLGNGSGSFNAAIGSPFAVENSPASVAVADVNGDGKPDLVVANNGNSANDDSVLLGTGGGSFIAAPSVGHGTRPQTVVLGDVNGDGKPDIVTSGRYHQDSDAVLLGDGSGGFNVDAGSPFATGVTPRDAQLGDVNGDGRLDIVTTNLSSSTISLFLNHAVLQAGPVTTMISVPTDIALSATVVAENNTPLTTVGTFSATDLNGGPYTYSLVSGTGSTDNASFGISGSALQIVPRTSFETQSKYFIRVRVTDQFSATYEKQFEIDVINQYPAPAGMVGWWPAEGNATDVKNGNNGTLNGATFGPGEVNQAFNFNGGSYVSVPSSPSLNVTSSLSIEGWVNLSTNNFNNGLVYKGTLGIGSQGAYSLGFFTGGSNQLVFRLNENSRQVVSSTSFVPSQWYHVAATYDGTTMKVYVNGVLDGSVAYSASISTNSSPLIIGGYYDSPYLFHGKIDELSIYNQALTPAEIQGIVTASIAGKALAPVGVADSFIVNENNSISVAAPGVLSNDSSPEMHAITAVLITGPAHGTVSLSADGSFTYTPANSFHGTDAFVYEDTSSDGNSDPTTVTLTVQSVLTVGANQTIYEGSTFSSTGSIASPVDETWTATVDYGDGSGTQPLAFSGSSFALSHIYADNGSYTVVVNATKGSSTVTDSLVVTALNVAPTLAISGASSSNEGAAYTLALSSSDPGADTINHWTINWGDGNLQTVTGNPAAVLHTYVDGPNSYTISATATDEDGTFNANTLVVTVKNVVPTLVISGNSSTNNGVEYTLGLSSSDSGSDTINHWTINWGDGSIQTVSGNPSSVLHLYNSGSASYVINATATDEDGAYLANPLLVTVDANVLSISDASVVEGDSGKVAVVFTVSLGAPASTTVTVDYTAIATGTASATDFDPIPNPTTLIFAPGDISKTITVWVNGDTIMEPNETFVVNLTNPTRALIYDNFGLGTIVDDDLQPVYTIPDGPLDTTWSNDGKNVIPVTTNYDPFGSSATVIDGDGRPIQFGSYDGSTELRILRYNPDGEPDTTWAGTGLSDFHLPNNQILRAEGGTVYTSGPLRGKVLAIASMAGGVDGWDWLIARYNVDGTLDTSFGNGKGYLTTSFSPFDRATTIAIYEDGPRAGQFVVGGFHDNGSQAFMEAARYFPDGTLDHSFGTNGQLTYRVNTYTDAASSFKPDEATSVSHILIDGNDKLVVSGTTGMPGTYNSAYGARDSGGFIARFNDDGTIDSKFGTSGVTFLPFNADSRTAGTINDLEFQTDGKILAVASTDGGHFQVMVVRLLTDGTPDPSFAGTAIAGDGLPVVNGIRHEYPAISIAANSIRETPTGKIIVGGGYAPPGVGGAQDTLAIRYNSDGTFDTTWDVVNHDPDLVVDAGSGLQDSAQQSVITPDGNYLLAGGANNGPEFGTAKFQAQRVDTAVSLTSDITQVLLDGTITYTIHVTNTGDDAEFASIKDLLPAHTVFVSLTVPSGWVASTPAVGSAGTIVAATRNLVSGDDKVLLLKVKLDGTETADQVISDSVQTSSAYLDYDTTNNSATVTDTISEDLSVDMGQSNIGVVSAGNQDTFIICVDNHSSLPASYVATTTLPANTTFVSATGGYTLTGNTLTWYRASLGANESESLRFVVTATATGTLHTNAIVTGIVPDTTPIDNSSDPPSYFVSYWKADGNATDAVGPNPGILQNGATFGPGYDGQAFHLDGVNDDIAVPNSVSMDNASFTASARFMTSSFVPISVILDKPFGTATNDSFVIWFQNGNLNAGITSSSQQFVSVSVPLTPSTNTWYQATETYDSSTGKLNLYLNGGLVASTTTATGFMVGYDSHPLYIGAGSDNESVGFFWNGSIDEVYQFNKALSPTEVRSLDYSQRFGVSNLPPTINASASAVTVDEGQVATNSGLLSDPDGESCCVIVTSSIGTVIQNPKDLSQWLWTFDSTDGPDQSQPVTITVNDGHGGITNTVFQLTVNNVAPTLTISGASSTDEGSLYTLGLLSEDDPGTDTIAHWTIDWGDGNIQIVNGNPGSVEHIYADGPNTDTIKATATDEDGTYASNDLLMTVNNIAPTLVISGASSTAEGSVYALGLSSSDPGQDTIVHWTINWGDGNSDIVSGNPSSATHVYADGPNAYTISATATDEDGTFNANTVAVAVNNVAPALVISGPGSTNEGSVYTLGLSSSDPGADTIVHWTINWGDGNTQTLSGNPLSATHVYADGPNAYTISATATDEDGTFDANTLAVTVNNVAPTLIISGLSSTDEAAVYTLGLSSSDPGQDTIVHWTINWGDGSTDVVSGNPSSATHVYADGPNAWTISATATDEDGIFGANTLAVTVNNVAPTLVISGAATTDEAAVYTLDLSSNDPGPDTIVHWTINWGDGNTQTVSGNPSSATHVYADGPNVFTITATATDEDGTFNANNLAVTVNNVAPTLVISGATSTNEGSTYTLGLSSSDPGADTINHWTINWGDGNTQTVSGNPSSATHVYADGPNSFTVSATATDEDGTFNANSLAVTVNNVAPTLVISGASITDEGSVYTLGLSSSDPGQDTINHWTIIWGDGITQTVSGNPSSATHVYADGPNAFTISATATDEDGTFNGNNLAVTVNNVAPTLVISGASSTNEGSTYTLGLSSSDPGLDTINHWTINWGDGNTQTVTGNPSSVTHVYADGPNAFTIAATATDEDGTFNANNQAVTVNNVAPMLVISGATSTNEGSAYTLGLSSSDPGQDTINHWTINWGDGNTQTVSGNPSSATHIYADGPNSITVSATATDEDGTFNANNLAVTVKNVAPTLMISGASSTDEGSVYTLGLSSSDPGTDTIVHWTIDWGDGNTQTVSGNPSSATHVYADGPNSFMISATATDEDGIFDANSIAVIVNNVAPTLVVSGASVTDEGSIYTLGLSSSDPGADTIDHWTINWGDGNTQTVSGNPLSATHVYADGPNAFTISATATDEDGTFSANGIPVTVNNVAPTL
ncbi:MAG: vcbs repeat-containing protein, partial [Planctomycetaceae bacterium]|nr:vcbs repeat-containing protein [Planctomycetaceae bacterium]